MSRRARLGIVAALVLGALAWAPAPAGAQALLGWTVTIDPYDGAVASRQVDVAGRAAGPLGANPSSVTVELTPSFDACGTEPIRQTVTPTRGRYRASLPTPCNGPYRIRVVGRIDGLGGSTSPPTTGDVGVAEAPGAPGPPTATTDGSAVRASWGPTADPDAAGWILVADGADVARIDDPATTRADLPAGYGGAALRLKAIRWGAGGPGTSVASSPSGESRPTPVTRGTVPERTPVEPPPAQPPAATPAPGGGGTPPPAGTTPRPSAGRIPTRGTGSGATLPEGYTDELPYGVPDDAFVPGEASSEAAADDGAERAAGTSPSAGLVRTSERRAPGLVAPFALGLMMITIAAHIAWYLRRSRPTAGGQVSAP